MTHEHVLTRSVRDSAGVLDACAGSGPGDPYTAPAPRRPWSEEVRADPGRLRIGVRVALPGGKAPHPDCVAATEVATTQLAALGHDVVELELPAFDEDPIDAYSAMLGVHVASELDRIGALARGTITEGDVEPDTWLFAEIGRAVSGTQLVEATHAMQRYARGIARAWSDVDVILTPQSAVPPPPIGSVTSDLEVLMGIVAFTIPFNITGEPAMSLPLHWPASGLPIGVQLVAPQGGEDVLFRLAGQLEQAHPWSDRRPGVHA